MSKTATLKGKISLDDTEFQKVIRRATDRVKKFGSDVASAAGNAAKMGLAGIGAAGLGASAGLLAAAKSAADLGGQLSDASAVTGIAAGKMLVLQQAFANAGMSGEGAAGIIAKLQAAIGKSGMLSEEAQEKIDGYQETIDELREQKNAGGLDPKEIAKINKQIATQYEKIRQVKAGAKGAALALQQLGLNQNALAQMDGADQLQAVLEALGSINNQSQKMALLKMLKLPPELMVLAKDPNAFKDATTQLGSLPGIMDQFAGKFDRVSDIANAKFGILFKQIGAGFLSSIVDNDAFQALLAKFESLDLGFIGEEIGTRLSGVIDLVSSAIKEGNLGELLLGALSVGAVATAETFIKVMDLAIRGAGALFDTIMSQDGKAFLESFGAGLIGVLSVAAFQFGKAMKLLLIDLEAALGDSTLGRAWSGIKATGAAVGYLGAGVANTLTLGAMWDQTAALQEEFRKTMGENLMKLADGPESVAEIERSKVLNDNRIPWMDNMTAEQALQKSIDNFAQAGDRASKITDEFGENLRKRLKDASSQEGKTNTATVTESLRKTLRNQEQVNAFDQIINGPNARPAVPIGIERQQVPQVPKPMNQLQWQFQQEKNKQSSDAKQVSLLEQTVALLERNLTAMQVA